MSTINDVDLQEIQQKLYERLKPSGWADQLKGFILSEDFLSILQTLHKEATEGKRFTPALKQVFRAFEECPYNELKAVIVGQDPYPYQGVADGIAFSCGNDGKVQASLRYMFKEIEDTVYPTEGYTWDPDLSRWSKQGILIINTALTTTINKVGQHYTLWQPFVAYVLDMLAFNNPGLTYAFMGNKAKEWMRSVPDNNYKLMCTHPASAAHAYQEKWDSGNIFNKISDSVKKSFNYDIKW